MYHRTKSHTPIFNNSLFIVNYPKCKDNFRMGRHVVILHFTQMLPE